MSRLRLSKLTNLHGRKLSQTPGSGVRTIWEGVHTNYCAADALGYADATGTTLYKDIGISSLVDNGTGDKDFNLSVTFYTSVYMHAHSYSDPEGSGVVGSGNAIWSLRIMHDVNTTSQIAMVTSRAGTATNITYFDRDVCFAFVGQELA